MAVHDRQPSSPMPLDHYAGYNTDIFATRATSLHQFPQPMLQQAPASPVSISPPRMDLREPSTAHFSYSDYSPPTIRQIHTPDSTYLADSLHGLSLQAKPEDSNDPFYEPVQLQYAHQRTFNDSPQKKPYKMSHMIGRASTSSPHGEDQATNLSVPHPALVRPSSSHTPGLDDRVDRHTPLSTEHRRSASGSPQRRSPASRTTSAQRRSPSRDFRPMSYVDLLNEVPYSQQIAPAPMMNNSSLQMAVGNSASLLDTNKTLEMYRANVKKTNDPAIQYEFAIFMVNAARDAMIQEGLPQQARPLTPKADAAAEMIKEARGILNRLSDRAYPFAQYYLADGYFSGLFNKGKPDYNSAFPLFVAASKHGHAEAGYRAALCYEFGWGCSPSFPRAVQFFRNAASKGHPGAAVRLGKACLKGDMGLVNKHREGVKWLKRASESADAQYNSGPYELGLLHITGFGDDVFKDEEYAAQLLTEAAELGHTEANFKMGEAYEHGKLGCPRDAALSVHFYNGAATRGMPEAMMALCAWYMVGADPVLEKDEAEAFEWAKQAAELALPKAQYAVGYFTEMGIGCRRDPLEANMWYVRAAELGDTTARQRLDIIRAAAAGEEGVHMMRGKARVKELRGGGGGGGEGRDNEGAKEGGKEKGREKEKEKEGGGKEGGKEKECIVM